MRLSTPFSRRKVRLKASAENVVDSTAMPAMPGTITSRLSWLSLKIAPNSARKSSGSRKLKNAALGLRQNSRRSIRYWRQVRATASGLIGGQLQVDLLERRARHLEVLQALAAGQRLAGELVQERRRVVGDVLEGLPARVAVGDAHPPGRVHAQLARRALGEDAAALDDRHAVGQRLCLVEVVRGQQDRLAQLAQRADRRPRVAARGGVEARRRLVEEDQLRVADQRQAEVQPPQLAARQLARLHRLLALQPDERDDLVDVARVRVHPREVRERLAHADVAVDARLLQDDAHPLAQLARPPAGVEAQHRDLARPALAIALEDLDRRRLSRAVGPEQPVDLAPLDAEVDAAHGLDVSVGLAQAANFDGGFERHSG